MKDKSAVISALVQTPSQPTYAIPRPFFSAIPKQSDELLLQPDDFPQRVKSSYSSVRSPLRGTMPAHFRMTSASTTRLFSKQA